MKNMPIYEALAQAFAAEGVDTQFVLMGDGNMHHATAMKNLAGMGTFSARRERAPAGCSPIRRSAKLIYPCENAKR